MSTSARSCVPLTKSGSSVPRSAAAWPMRRTPPLRVAFVPVTVAAEGTLGVEPSPGTAAGLDGAQPATTSNTASTADALVQAKGRRKELGIGGILGPER